jgi:deazaflavin-dependent oxidoreductase (nitroreductase family)
MDRSSTRRRPRISMMARKQPLSAGESPAACRVGLFYVSDLNNGVISEFRANRGVVTEAMGGHFKDTTVVLVQHIGRRTGKQYVQPLVGMSDGGNYVVVGSNGGHGQEPLWVGNVEAMPQTTIELGERIIKVKPTVLRDGAERDRLYAEFAKFWPDLRKYEKHTDRPFPVVVLKPIS